MSLGPWKKYPKEIWDSILEQMTQGKSLKEICAQKGMPTACAVRLRCLRDAEFKAEFDVAKQMQAEAWADEALAICDDDSKDWKQISQMSFATGEVNLVEVANVMRIQRDKMRIHQRNWMAARFYPKVFGDKVQSELSGPDGKDLPVILNIIRKEE